MFKKGDKVICKDISYNIKFNSIPRGITKGKIYTILKVTNCKCCGIEDIELEEVIALEKWCGKCDDYKGFVKAYHSFRFEKIKYDIISNKELVKNIFTIEQEIVQEQIAVLS